MIQRRHVKAVSGPANLTQRITSTDKKNRRIRIPQGMKKLFPDKRSELSVRIRGRSPVSAIYYPNDYGKARSGVLTLHRDAFVEIRLEERLSIRFDVDGTLCLD